MKDEPTGIAIRFIEQYDIATDQHPTRWDEYLVTEDFAALVTGEPCFPSALDC